MKIVQFFYIKVMFICNCTESPLALESSNSVFFFFFLGHRRPVGFSDILYNFKFNSVSSVRSFCNLIELIVVHAFSEGQ